MVKLMRQSFLVLIIFTIWKRLNIRHHILQSIKAKEFFIKDVDYVVRDGEVIIVDEFTGRMMPGRRWSDGLHQAVEAREKTLKLPGKTRRLATITFQNYFRLVRKAYQG